MINAFRLSISGLDQHLLGCWYGVERFHPGVGCYDRSLEKTKYLRLQHQAQSITRSSVAKDIVARFTLLTTIHYTLLLVLMNCCCVCALLAKVIFVTGSHFHFKSFSEDWASILDASTVLGVWSWVDEVWEAVVIGFVQIRLYGECQSVVV